MLPFGSWPWEHQNSIFGMTLGFEGFINPFFSASVKEILLLICCIKSIGERISFGGAQAYGID
jgi:hypothetical protein